MQETSFKITPIMNGPAPIAVTGTANMLYFADQTGLIMQYNPQNQQSVLFLDLRPLMAPLNPDDIERGLMDIALTPDQRRLLVFYTSKPSIGFENRYPDGQNVLVEYDINTKLPSILMRILENADIHVGGKMAFGSDGYLYLATGDGGPTDDDPEQRAQNLSSLLGKVLRIDVSRSGGYSIPLDNPFVGYRGLRPEIYAYGFRNPLGLCFSNRGVGYISDAGRELEEIAVLIKGGNYGWNIKEGTQFTNIKQGVTGGTRIANVSLEKQIFVDPVYEYPTGEPGGITVQNSAVIGGCPLQEGPYVFGDYGGVLMALNGNDELIYSEFMNEYIRAFSKDTQGNVYIMTSDSPGLRGNGTYSLITS